VATALLTPLVVCARSSRCHLAPPRDLASFEVEVGRTSDELSSRRFTTYTTTVRNRVRSGIPERDIAITEKP
jgi:hypothetical protein